MRQQIDDFLHDLEAEKDCSENTISAYRNDLTQFSEFITQGVQTWQEVDKNSLVLVAEVEAQIVGFLLATVTSRTEYEPSIIGNLSSIYVRSNYRRRGVGSRLIREACRFFSVKNAKHIYVRYVLGNNEGKRFWKHLQLKPILVTAGAPRSKIEDQIGSR